MPHLFLPRFLTVRFGFFFPHVYFLYYPLGPLESFKAHYTDSTYVSYVSVPPLKQNSQDGH